MKKLVSLKKQFKLSIVPFFWYFYVLFCGWYNLRGVKCRAQTQVMLYWLLCMLPVMVICGGGAAIARLCTNSVNILSVCILVLMWLGTLVAGIFGVWLQKKTLQRIEKDENAAYLP